MITILICLLSAKISESQQLAIRDFFIIIKNLVGHFVNDGDRDKLFDPTCSTSYIFHSVIGDIITLS